MVLGLLLQACCLFAALYMSYQQLEHCIVYYQVLCCVDVPSPSCIAQSLYVLRVESAFHGLLWPVALVSGVLSQRMHWPTSLVISSMHSLEHMFYAMVCGMSCLPLENICNVHKRAALEPPLPLQRPHQTG